MDAIVEILEDFDREPVTWRTYTDAGTDGYGRASRTVDATVEDQCVVHPRRPAWGEQRPDATRQYEEIAVYTERPEPALEPDRPEPELDYGGHTFQVVGVKDWRSRAGVAVFHARRELGATP